MMTDLKTEAQRPIARRRIPGVPYDDVLYADDTILLSTRTDRLQAYLGAIEQVSGWYGLKLNYDKCELLVLNGRRYPALRDGRKLKRVESARYLGCQLNKKTNGAEEVSNRIRICIGTWRRLGYVWKHSGCNAAHKIRLWEAIIGT